MPETYRIPQGSIHFPNLNGLRFLAALLVVIHHIEQIRAELHLPNHWGNNTIKLIGAQGVTLFFVLSGFLITYLLLAEREKFSGIDIRKFYLRRILRIWPLYYMMVVLGLLLIPRLPFFYIPGLSEHALDNLPQKIVLFGLIIPNAAIVLYGAVPYLSQSWSIGTEEQFYLFWPWLVQAAGRKVLPVLIGTACFFVSLKVLISIWYQAAGPTPGPVLSFCFNFLQVFRIECMAIGAVLGAVLYLRRDGLLSLLMARSMQWVVIITIIGLLSWGYYIPMQQVVYAILFAVFILNQAAAIRPALRLEYRWLNFLGKVSYGLYMLHMLAVVTVLRTIAPWLDAQGPFVSWPLTLIAVLLLTAVLASASYYGLEKPFLRFKESFVRIRSHPDAALPSETPASVSDLR